MDESEQKVFNNQSEMKIITTFTNSESVFN